MEHSEWNLEDLKEPLECNFSEEPNFFDWFGDNCEDLTNQEEIEAGVEEENEESQQQQILDIDIDKLVFENESGNNFIIESSESQEQSIPVDKDSDPFISGNFHFFFI